MEILINFKEPRGYVKYVTTNAGEVWALKGDCKRCGECCEVFNMTLKEISGPGGKCTKFSYETINGERLGKCNIREMRPAFCMLYPRDPDEILPAKCGYKWSKIN